MWGHSLTSCRLGAAAAAADALQKHAMIDESGNNERTQNRSRSEQFCRTMSRKRKFQLKSEHNFLFYFIFVFLLSGSVPTSHFNSSFFFLPDPLGVLEGCNCSLWIYLLDQIMRSNWSDSRQKLLNVLKAALHFDQSGFFFITCFDPFSFSFKKLSTAYGPLMLLSSRMELG